jgi:hypothetical protein
MLVDDAIHAIVRVMLRVRSPERVHAWVTYVGSLLPQAHTETEVRRIERELGKRGTCLSRALTLAARAPDVEVVIGVTPRPGARLFAHAWAEIEGKPLDPMEVAGDEIARLSPTRRES